MESSFDRYEPVRGPVPTRPRTDDNPLNREAYLDPVLRRGVRGKDVRIIAGMKYVNLGGTGLRVSRVRPGRVEDALAAERLELAEQEILRLEELYVAHPVRGRG